MSFSSKERKKEKENKVTRMHIDENRTNTIDKHFNFA